MNFLQILSLINALEHINVSKPETFKPVLSAIPENVKNTLVTAAIAESGINIPAFLGTLPPDIKAQVVTWAATQTAPTPSFSGLTPTL